MTDIVDAPSIDELYDEFDLDIRIDDIYPTDPNRIPLASVAMSCTMCCPGESQTCHDLCHTQDGCTVYSYCLCTEAPC
jgi:hypothetical protein